MNTDRIHVLIALLVVTLANTGLLIHWRFSFDTRLETKIKQDVEAMDKLQDFVSESRGRIQDLEDTANQWN